MNQDTGQTFGLFGALLAVFVVVTAVLIAAQGLGGMILNLLGGMLMFSLVAGVVFAGLMIAFAVLAWIVMRMVSTPAADKGGDAAA